MKKNIINYPPSWCPDAIPSDRGWRHPKTGELLVSVRGGVQPLKQHNDKKELIVEIPKNETIISEVIENPIIDETIKSEPVIVDEQPKEIISEKESPKKRRSTKTLNTKGKLLKRMRSQIKNVLRN